MFLIRKVIIQKYDIAIIIMYFLSMIIQLILNPYKTRDSPGLFAPHPSVSSLVFKDDGCGGGSGTRRV